MNNKFNEIKDIIIDKALTVIAYIIAFFLSIPKRFKRYNKRVHLLFSGLDLNEAVLSFVTYISLIIVTALCVIYIIQMLSNDVQIITYVDGNEIGIVENTFIVEGSRIRIENEINSLLKSDEKYVFEHEITYKFANTSEKVDVSIDDCYKYLNNISSMGVIEMTSLYVDGKYIGSLSNCQEFLMMIEEDRDNFFNDATSIDSKITEIELNNKIEIHNERRIKTDLSEYEEIRAMFVDNTVDLRYITITYDIFTEVIKCEVEYQDSDTMYIGLEQQTTEGSDGIFELKYEVRHLDGKLLSEELVSEQFIINPEPTIILKGTKQPPPSESTGVFMWPLDMDGEIKPQITSYFAEQREEFDGDAFHYGIDIATNENNFIYASDGGYVDYSEESHSYGNMVRILHKNGMASYYAHMSERLVEMDEYVYPGQIIGKIGMTGVATAPHLHFEIREGMMPLDPLKFLP